MMPHLTINRNLMKLQGVSKEAHIQHEQFPCRLILSSLFHLDEAIKNKCLRF